MTPYCVWRTLRGAVVGGERLQNVGRVAAWALAVLCMAAGCDDDAEGEQAPAESPAQQLPGSIESKATEPAEGCPAREVEAQLERPGTVHQRDVRARETWTRVGSPHRLPQGAHIHRNGHVTIESCALVIVGDGRDIHVDGGGTLVAGGRQDAPVRFGAASRQPSPGAWHSITFDGNARPQSRLAHAVIEDAGGGSRRAAVHVEGDYALDLRHVTIRHAQQHGVVLADEARFAEDAEALTVTDSGRKDPYSVPVRFHSASQVRTLPQGTYTGNATDEIFVEKPRVRTSAEWRDVGVPYRLAEGLDVGSPNGAVLTVLPGTQLLFNRSTALAVGHDRDGAIVLDGSQGDKRVVLSSGRPQPAPGDWQGVRIGPARADSAMKLDFVAIRYAGAEPGSRYRVPSGETCRPSSRAAIAIESEDMGERITNTSFADLPKEATAILLGFRSDEMTDYTAERHGNDFEEARTDCRQNIAPAEGDCPERACR